MGDMNKQPFFLNCRVIFCIKVIKNNTNTVTVDDLCNLIVDVLSNHIDKRKI
jgi:hypothetical protein